MLQPHGRHASVTSLRVVDGPQSRSRRTTALERPRAHFLFIKGASRLPIVPLPAHSPPHLQMSDYVDRRPRNHSRKSSSALYPPSSPDQSIRDSLGPEGCWACRYRKKGCQRTGFNSCVDCSKFNICCSGMGEPRPSVCILVLLFWAYLCGYRDVGRLIVATLCISFFAFSGRAHRFPGSKSPKELDRGERKFEEICSGRFRLVFGGNL